MNFYFIFYFKKSHLTEKDNWILTEDYIEKN